MNPYLGMVFIFGGNFAISGFAFCNGTLLAISTNTALFSILGTTYGGNGTTNFALPDLRGRVPISFGQGPGLSSYNEGQTGGTETNTLVTNQLPAHSHSFKLINAPGTTGTPGPTTFLSQAPTTGSGPNAVLTKFFTTGEANTTLNQASIGTTGGGSPVNNLPPYLTMNYIIALQGIFPSRN